MGPCVSKETARDELQEMKAALSENGLQKTLEQINKDFDELKKSTVDIAITGMSGAGKSSLVNALREMTDDEEGAAETGVLEMTMDLKGFSHPLIPNVTFWDLPGIGTSQFKAAEYTKTFNFKEYDLFIIVSSERFTENDILLVREIKKLNKKFYFVRTKVDVSIDSEKRRPNFTEENTLEKIKRDCRDNLTKVGESNPRVFLISRWDLNMYEFPCLYKTLENDLDDFKRQVLIDSMPGFSREILKKKKDAMNSLIWKMTLKSCTGSNPVPSLPFDCNIVFLEEKMRHICKVFGMDEFALNRLAHWVGMPFDELRSAVKSSPMVSQITPEFVTDQLAKHFVHGKEITSYVLDYILLLGSLRNKSISLTATYCMLKSFLNDVEEDAENVRAKAAQYVSPQTCKVSRNPSEKQTQAKTI